MDSHGIANLYLITFHARSPELEQRPDILQSSINWTGDGNCSNNIEEWSFASESEGKEIFWMLLFYHGVSTPSTQKLPAIQLAPFFSWVLKRTGWNILLATKIYFLFEGISWIIFLLLHYCSIPCLHFQVTWSGILYFLMLYLTR